jgi:hypothetical protein
MYPARCYVASGWLLLIAALLGGSPSVYALGGGNRGEPPPLRLGDSGPTAAPEQAEDEVDAALRNLAVAPPSVASESQPAEAAAVSCRPDRQPGLSEAQVVCSDGKSWTMRSAGLMLATVPRCTTEHPECCELAYRNMRELQIADLIRVGQGQAPVCHIRVSNAVTNPSVSPPPADDEEDAPTGLFGVQTLGVPSAPGGLCPSGLYLVLGRCYDARALLRVLRPPAIEDPNPPLVPEFAERLRRAFDAAAGCPLATLDIDGLERFADFLRRRADTAPEAGLDVTALRPRAQTPGNAMADAQLPVSCNYNPETQRFEQTTFFCATKNICYAQGRPALTRTCVRFDRATAKSATSPSFFPIANCMNLPSCFEAQQGQCIGMARFFALGSGVFLLTLEDARKKRNSLSVVFARRMRTPADLALARQARELLYQIGRNVLSSVERERLDALINAQPE